MLGSASLLPALTGWLLSTGLAVPAPAGPVTPVGSARPAGIVAPVGLAAAPPVSSQYMGQTSQGEAIAFSVVSGKVMDLRFFAILGCRSGDRYRSEAYGFAPIAVRQGHFDATFPSHRPPARATIKGRVHRRRVRGRLRLSRWIRSEHAFCSATADFDLRARRTRRGRLRDGSPSTTMTSANDWPSGRENTSK